ncbi:MAG TPA: protein kinase, partial [Polyangiales bacterium]
MAAAGDTIGRFTLVRQLGAGGMGETWEAVRQNGSGFEQRVAIKLADPGTLDTPESLAAFRSEASLAASLRHPNIAGVLDIDDRSGYIVCELVDGADLRQVLRAAPGGKLPAPVLVHVIAQIARGLSHAHRRVLRGKLSPVVHRDMSPGNVVLDYDGNVKIVDFGIAQAIASSDHSNAVEGKLSYMAPEQAMGQRLDGRVDQYALGVIAYEALTAVRPNDGAHDGETLASILAGKHVALAKRAPRLDRALAAVIERMLSLQPAQRFASMEAVLDALAPFAPPLTIHRDLIPLVMHARQPHTILRENGKFVSRPVSLEVPLMVAAASASVAPSPRIAWAPPASVAPRPVPLLNGGRSEAAPAIESARPGLLVQALVSTLSSKPEPAPAATPQPSAAEVAGDVVVERRSRRPPEVRAKSRRRGAATRQRSLRALVRRVTGSRGFWQALTALGALLLGLVTWVALSPDAPRSLAAILHGRSPVPAAAGLHAPLK